MSFYISLTRVAGERFIARQNLRDMIYNSYKSYEIYKNYKTYRTYKIYLI